MEFLRGFYNFAHNWIYGTSALACPQLFLNFWLIFGSCFYKIVFWKEVDLIVVISTFDGLCVFWRPDQSYDA